jgi:hypothetical protein
MRALSLLLLVAACQSHEARILLGPNEDTVSIGFLCTGEDGTELIRRSEIASPFPPQVQRLFQFAVVVDIVDIGDRVLGCRGEELITACEGGGCSIIKRACHVVTLRFMGEAPDVPTILAKLREQLADFTVTEDAPDKPVVLRVVFADLPETLDPNDPTCPADIASPATSLEATALGCAYSCPIELDNVDRVSLTLDTLTRDCEPAMRICAGFL